MQTSVSGFLSLLEKNHNRVLDYLVSILEKRFLHCLLQSSWGLFYLVKAPFNPVQALLHPVWALFCPVQTLFQFRPDLFSSRVGLFMLNGVLLQTERPPYPQCLARL